MRAVRGALQPLSVQMAGSHCHSVVSGLRDPWSAQVPPPETNAFTLVDVGPVSVSAACPCITNPFTVPTIRPGGGYPSGPAAPLENAVPSAAARRLQAQRDAEDRAEFATTAEDGLAGNPHASLWVAMQLTGGTAIPRNDEEAARWLHLAATQGHRDAYLQLGYRYHRGLGVRRNDKTAAYWIHTGASAGDRHAMVALGLLYAAGRGVPQDWSAAVAWWQQARSSGGDPLASRFLGDAYVCGLGIAQNYEEAVLAYKEWVDKGDMSSSIQLGHMYASGCAPANDEAAVAAYRLAADQGDPEAQVSLSGLVREGRGVERDAFEAYYWARLAERRLPPGKLRERAEAQTKLAARLMSAAHVKDTDAFVESVIVEGAKPMR